MEFGRNVHMDSLEVNQYKSVFTIYTIYRYQNFQPRILAL